MCQHLRGEGTKAGTVCLHIATGKHSTTVGAVPVAVLSWKADGGSDQEIFAIVLFTCCLPADCVYAKGGMGGGWGGGARGFPILDP